MLGRGGMGAVFLARDPAGSDLAIKLIDPELLEDDGRARFAREGEALARLPAHANVVQVRGSGEHAGWPYLALEFVPGDSLQALLKAGPVTVRRAVGIALSLARATAHFHAH